MEIQVEDLFDKLKHSSEKLDNQFKSMIDIIDEMKKTIEELDYDLHELEKEIK